MTSLLIATKDSLLNNSFQTLYRISQIVTYIIYCKHSTTYPANTRDNAVFPFDFQDLMAAIGSKYQQKKPNKNPEGPEAVFNALDRILKCSLERLKLMRESMSWEHINHHLIADYYNQYTDTIRNLSLEGRLGVALSLRDKMLQKNIIPDVVTHNYLINGLCKINAIDKAEWLVNQMLYHGPPPNCATYNTLMKGYCCNNDIDKALDLLSVMTNGKVKPNIVTFNILVHALCKKGFLKEARVLLLRLTNESSYESGVVALTILMDSCFKNGDTDLALTLWGEICEKNKNVVAYNVLVYGSCLRWNVVAGYKYVTEMLKIGLNPDIVTYNILMHAFFKVGWRDEACYIFNTVMSGMGVIPNRVSYNVLIQGLCLVGDVMTAHRLLDRMLEKSMAPDSPILWNKIIDGYGKIGDKRNACFIKDLMIKYSVLPNVFTYNALIRMFIKCGEIGEAHLMMKEMLVSGPLPDTVTYNLLVRAESEFGHLYSAHEVYDDMLKRGYNPDVVTYTQIIKGYCLRGKVKEAENFFNFEMLHDPNVVIDHVPFQVLMKKYFKMRDFDRAYGVYLKWLKGV